MSTSFVTFDSEFFGKRIGRSGPDPFLADKDAQAEDLDCVYLFTSSEIAPEAERLGFELMAAHLTLVRPPQAFVVRPLRYPTPAEADEMEALARRAFTHTRFRRDRHFDRERVDALYGYWLRVSYEGWAQFVRVAERDGRAAGFVTVRDQKIDIAAALYEGQGIGTELILGAINYAYDMKMPELRVTLQIDNLNALRLFERCGFLAEETELIFHKWYR